MLTREFLRHHQQLPLTLPKIIINKQLCKYMFYFLTLLLSAHQISHLSQKTVSHQALTERVPSLLSYYKTAMDRNRLQKELRPVQTPIQSCASTFSLLHKHTEEWKREYPRTA